MGITIYKKQEEKRFKEKYNVGINFIGRHEVNYENGIFYAGLLNKENKDIIEIVEENDSDSTDIIENLENEVDDIIRLIGELEVMKYEAIA
ncbi:MAG TPA: hypothetical protein EYG73_03805 [Arcobacter sp.]|nr:hypothetical protein [Arcobacter sp.]